MENKEIVTVNYLLEILKRASENGFGNMKFKCVDGFLYTDEITGCYYGKNQYFEIKGRLYNTDIYKKMINFCNAVERAQSKFLDYEHNIDLE